MFFAVIVLLWCLVNVTGANWCNPASFLCTARCPPVPEHGFRLDSTPRCRKDAGSGACVCWFQNPSAEIVSVFLCDARINGTTSKLMCRPPSHCFEAAEAPSCLIVTHCPCLDAPSGEEHDTWVPVRATIHVSSINTNEDEDQVVEKIQDVREFSLKHLLFLIGFVIAPLFCWCLLNFLHEGKCRKKPPLLPETQPIPTNRSSTVDSGMEEAEVPLTRSPSMTTPSAPDLEGQSDALRKCESPPPYNDSMEDRYVADCGPPPTYEDAMQETVVTMDYVGPSLLARETTLGTRDNV